MTPRLLPRLLVAVAALLALWPVTADASRYELEVRAGVQPAAQVQSRWDDPVQRPFLEARPSCGVPMLAPLTYTQDGALRQGCAGPNARSMSLSVLLLVAGGLVASRCRLAAVEPALSRG